MFDKDQLRLEILAAQARKSFRDGGYPPRQWAVMLVAVICGIVAMTLALLFQQRKLLVILDTSLPFAVLLAYLSTRWWAAPIQRRPALFVALVTAAALCMAAHGVIGIVYQLGPEWILWHLGETTVWLIAAIMLMGCEWPPWRGTYRWPASKIVDPQDRDHLLCDLKGPCRPLPSFQRRFYRSVAERVA